MTETLLLVKVFQLATNWDAVLNQASLDDRNIVAGEGVPTGYQLGCSIEPSEPGYKNQPPIFPDAFFFKYHG